MMTIESLRPYKDYAFSIKQLMLYKNAFDDYTTEITSSQMFQLNIELLIFRNFDVKTMHIDEDAAGKINEYIQLLDSNGINICTVYERIHTDCGNLLNINLLCSSLSKWLEYIINSDLYTNNFSIIRLSLYGVMDNVYELTFQTLNALYRSLSRAIDSNMFFNNVKRFLLIFVRVLKEHKDFEYIRNRYILLNGNC